MHSMVFYSWLLLFFSVCQCVLLIYISQYLWIEKNLWWLTCYTSLANITENSFSQDSECLQYYKMTEKKHLNACLLNIFLITRFCCCPWPLLVKSCIVYCQMNEGLKEGSVERGATEMQKTDTSAREIFCTPSKAESSRSRTFSFPFFSDLEGSLKMCLSQMFQQKVFACCSLIHCHTGHSMTTTIPSK